MNSFIPRWTRMQFIQWAKKRWPNTSFSKMRKKQLVAIYCNTKNRLD